MKILFLGTGAADWPAVKDKEEFFRRNSSALIDNCILIDPGPGVRDAIEEYGVDVSDIRYILVTHTHKDHFDKDTLGYLLSAGAKLVETENMTEISLDDYTVKVMKGNHSVNVVHYIISDGKSSVFYGLDSAWLMYDEMKALKANPVDYGVFDATVGFIEGDYRIFEHNSLNMVIEMKKSLTKYIKRFCISHMARSLHTDHKTLEDSMKEHDIEVAYDGMEAEF